MKVLSFFVLFLLLFPAISLAQTIEIEEGEEVESTYNIQTMITKKNAYIILNTEEPGKCEYGLEEFEYGDGENFEEINGTLHKAKINIEEGKSHRFKIKCVVEGKVGEEDIMFSVSRIPFFLLEKLDELENNVNDFEKEKTEYKNKLNIDDLELRIKELDDIVKDAKKSIEENEIEKLRFDISEGIRKKNEIENTFIMKSIQLSILESSKYVVMSIILIYLFLYLTTSFFIPYFRIKKNIKRMKEKEDDMTKLRQNTEMLYFHRKIDEETFNKMVIKEQEEIMRVRTKVSNLENKEKELVKGVLEPKTVIEWSLKEKIHIRDKIKKFMEKIKGIKSKINNI